MHKHLMGLTRGVLTGASLLLLASTGWAATGNTPVQAAGGGAAAEEYAKKSDLGFQWNGDARLRLDTRFRIHTVADPRFRLRLRVGAKGTFAGDGGFWGFGLATNANDAVSRNITLSGGDIGGTGGNFGVDLAYLGFRPHERVSLVLGKMANPYWASDNVFDPDLTPEGVALGWSIYPGQKTDVIRNVRLTTGYFWVREFANVTADPYAMMTQVRSTIGPVDTGLGFYWYGGLRNVPNAMNQAPRQWVGGRFAMDQMGVIHGKAAVPFKVQQFPMSVGGDIWFNTSTKGIAGSKQKLGWEARLDFPQLGKWNGMWGKLMIRGAESLQFSTFSPWADSDLGEGTGFKAGVHAKYTVPVAKNVEVGAAYFHYDQFTPFTPGRASTSRVMVDVSGKF